MSIYGNPVMLGGSGGGGGGGGSSGPIYLLDNTHFPDGTYDSSSQWVAKVYISSGGYTSFSVTTDSGRKCIYHGSLRNKLIQFLEPIPALATKLYVSLRASGNTGQYNLWTLNLVDAIGLTGTTAGKWSGQTKKSVSFTNYNSTAEAINSQAGVSINVSTPYAVPYQIVEIDLSDIQVETYVTIHSCDCEAWLCQIWYE